MGQISDTKNVLIPIADNIRFSDFISSILPLMNFNCPRITLFHVITMPVTSPLDPEYLNGIVSEFEETAKPIAEWFKHQEYAVTIKTAVARSVADAIIEETRNNEYSLVFMLKRRRTGFMSLFSRSTTKQVIEKCALPVVSVLI